MPSPPSTTSAPWYFGVAFYALAAVAAAAAIGSALLVESKRTLAEAGVLGAEVVPQAAGCSPSSPVLAIAGGLGWA